MRCGRLNMNTQKRQRLYSTKIVSYVELWRTCSAKLPPWTDVGPCYNNLPLLGTSTSSRPCAALAHPYHFSVSDPSKCLLKITPSHASLSSFSYANLDNLWSNQRTWTYSVELPATAKSSGQCRLSVFRATLTKTSRYSWKHFIKLQTCCKSKNTVRLTAMFLPLLLLVDWLQKHFAWAYIQFHTARQKFWKYSIRLIWHFSRETRSTLL